MNFIEASVFTLLIAVISVPLATRFRLPLEIFLVVGSSIISLIPGLPRIEINPTVIFKVLLPPILFSAAYFTSWRDFKANLRPITLLAFGLVIFTAVVVAWVATLVLGFSWAQGFLLGAIVSPSDISAAGAIIRKVGAPRRFISVLEGESLINDATALTIYRFSLAAIMLGTFSLPVASLQFLWIAFGGLAAGIFCSIVAVFLMERIKDAQAETTFTFIVAYISYFVAEHIGASGIISTVAAGIFFGIQFPQRASSQTRVNARASWATVIFIINGFAFTLLGFELPIVLKNLGDYSPWMLLFYGLLFSAIVILLRVIWVYPAAYIPRKLFPSIARKDPMPSWCYLLALGWTGMRGIVSLAAVLAVPYQIAPGVLFPHRDLLIFLTYCVILATLIPPALTLPALLRAMHLVEGEDKMKQEALARVRASEGIIGTIDEISKRERISAEITNEFRKQVERRLKVIGTQLSDNPYSSLSNDYLQFKKLTLAALQSERETLIRLRKSGEIYDDVFHQLIEELDIEQIRANTVRL